MVGVKPTYGLVSRYGLIAFASSLDQIGPFANNVTDAALLLEVIAGHDARDSTSLPDDAPSLLRGLDDGVAGKRVGVVRELIEGADDDVVAPVDARARRSGGRGCDDRRTLDPRVPPRAERVLPHRAGRGVEQPRALRRRALRAARGRRRRRRR